ncbi:MAG: lyase domain protein repeat-containing protein [Acidobacteria bacterium]|nr:lyase domain protein repeat-containing protein [Acidobacteriota bacterium]
MSQGHQGHQRTRRGPIVYVTFVVLCALVVRPVEAQGRLSNAQAETRSAAQGLEREVRAAAARGGVTWIGYRVPMVAGPRQMCCFDTISTSSFSGGMCRLESGGGVSMNDGDIRDRNGARIMLEPASEFLVLARLEGGSVSRIRTFTPDCDVDATAMPLVWLTDVNPDESVAWLASLASSAPDAGDRHDRVGKTAMSAVALHNVPAADRALERFVAPASPEWLRGDTAFWLGNARGDAGARLLARMMADDPSDKVREQAAFGLSVSKSPAAVTTLIAAARDDRSTKVRSRALFWLAHNAGKAAVAAISSAIDNDPETEVKKKAVFALSQLPKDEGVPKLMEVARNNRNPEVRRQAMFWLGQTHDPRAVKFFEEILTKR